MPLVMQMSQFFSPGLSEIVCMLFYSFTLNLARMKGKVLKCILVKKKKLVCLCTVLSCRLIRFERKFEDFRFVGLDFP